MTETINFDLHIHSYASKYKEGKGIVDNSTVENAAVLMSKLQESNVGLFSVTDHNRFWPELYVRLDELVVSGEYPTVQGLVAGVEFDVQFDPMMGKCHIITIFNAKNKIENYQKIYSAIDAHRIDSQDGAYSKQNFEYLLREIALDVILIACQRNSLEGHDGHHNSLSESTREPEELLLSGYINALEFQRPNVEGILRDNLKKIPNNVGLVMGSDCHEWLAYPNHDSKHGKPQFKHSRANILPTFKGLLMAVTSPETRINQQVNRNREYVQTLRIGGKEIPLVNGLIAIVGENGSGKSSLIKILHGKTSEPFVKRIMDKNEIHFSDTDDTKRLYIEQGQIVDQFGKGNLFPADNFLAVDHTEFREEYTSFANGILAYVKKRIQARDALNRLTREGLSYNELIHISSYYINLLAEDGYDSIVNPHELYDKDLKDLIEKIFLMRSDEYYEGYQQELTQVLDLLSKIYGDVHLKSDEKVIERLVKNCIISAKSEYDRKVEEASTSQQRDQRDYIEARSAFIRLIVDAEKNNTEELIFPSSPNVIHGYSSNPVYGFSFNAEAIYNDRDVLDDFFAKMFTAGYRSVDALKTIETYEELKTAVYRCGAVDQIDDQYQRNLTIFLDDMCSTKKYIVDTAQNHEALGNTLGELSLAYFKYMTEHETDKCIFLIDQPEDHISNNNISKSPFSISLT